MINSTILAHCLFGVEIGNHRMVNYACDHIVEATPLADDWDWLPALTDGWWLYCHAISAPPIADGLCDLMIHGYDLPF